MAGYPGGASYEGPREHDYGTSSSRGSADSYHGPSQPLAPLFRSSSDLHIDSSGSATLQEYPLRKEFGSTDLVEAKQAGTIVTLFTRPNTKL